MIRFALTLALLALTACSGGGDDRLIPGSDPQFRQLESPENDGECAASSECQDSCVHSCVPLSGGPVTCPSEPLPTPERLVGATCGCDATRCKWN